jgi:hypothetical protein
MNEFNWRVRDYARRYVDEGRIKTLVWFLIASFAIAGIEWALSPFVIRSWLDVSLSDRTYFVVLFIFASFWSAVVIAGFLKCGWAGLLMLIPIKWGLFPVYMIVILSLACASGDCL